MIGEGSNNACEVYVDGGWYVDPTNNLHIDDYYVKIAHGREIMMTALWIRTV